MPRNIEIKARINQLDAVLKNAELLSTGKAKIIEQEDIFFHVETGRLKLRFLGPSRGELIFYQRDDAPGPKTSTYDIVETDRPHDLRAVLARAYGEKIIVRKQRHLFMVGRTRIHVDSVKGLGDFLELEVMLDDVELPATGEQEALELMDKLGVQFDDLVEGAYADLLALAS